MFVLEARQLTSDAPVMAALALAIGGLGRYAWPETGKRRLLDLADRPRREWALISVHRGAAR